MVGVVSLVAQNWDLAVLLLVVAGALVADLVRGLRPRDFVVAGPDGLVVRVRGRTSNRPWSAVAGVEHVRGRSSRPRPALRLHDGTLVPLPRQAPADDVGRWVAESGDPPAPVAPPPA